MYTYKYPMPAIAIDLLMVYQNDILVIRRSDDSDAYPGMLALPGGFLNMDETVEEAAVRELREETGIELSDLDVSLVGVYSKIDRDPRQRTVGMAYAHVFPIRPSVKAGDDASECLWIEMQRVLKGEVILAFDHNAIVCDYFLT